MCCCGLIAPKLYVLLNKNFNAQVTTAKLITLWLHLKVTYARAVVNEEMSFTSNLNCERPYALAPLHYREPASLFTLLSIRRKGFVNILLSILSAFKQLFPPSKHNVDRTLNKHQ